MTDTIVLVDGHALLHRAFHALPPLTTSKGELVGAVFGFTSTLLKVLNEVKPRCVAVAFDRPGPTFRHLEFDAYKAQRPPAPEGLHQQLRRTKQVVETLGIPVYELDGYEADDVLGTLARQATEAGIDVLIVTGDNDALQLVGPHVQVLTPRRSFSDTVLYDEQGVRERYGIEPKQLIDYKALNGDVSDNIPKIPGIGEKTASELIARFGSVEGLYEHLDEVKPKLKDVLQAHAERARQNKHLATIVTDAPITIDIEACRLGQYDRQKMMELLRELEFRVLVNRLPRVEQGEGQPGLVADVVSATSAPTVESVVAPVQMQLFETISPATLQTGPATPVMPVSVVKVTAAGEYETVDSEEKLSALLKRLSNASIVAVDTETTSEQPMWAGLVGISLAMEPGRAYYIPVGHVDSGSGESPRQLPMEHVLAKLKPFLEDPKLPKAAHNAKYDLIVLGQHGIGVEGLCFDSLLAAYLLDPSGRAHNLKDLAWTKLGVEMTRITSLIGRGKKQITMAQVPIEAVAAYAGADADMTLRLTQLLEPELRGQGLGDLLGQVELPLVPVLAQMERVGIALDVPFLAELSGRLFRAIAGIEAQIYEAVGHQFNLNSPVQLAQVLFTEIKLPGTKKTKTGFSTAADVLDELRGTHAMVDLILEYRQLQKLKSTYVDALPLMVNPRTGRVHTSFNQAVVSTGRLSSSDPNLQNIPIRTELGRQVRRAFVAGESDCVLYAADYSQIDMRVLAHISGDPSLLAVFQQDRDIHTATAAEVFGVPPAGVTPELRRRAKAVNFGIVYGISGFGLGNSIGLPPREATRYIEMYLRRYPGVEKYMAEVKRFAQQNGYVTTLMGRRRYLPEINAANRVVRESAERMAINMPIQGTAADIIKVAMVRIARALRERGLRAKMLLQVHDELIFEVPRDEVAELHALVPKVMEEALPLCVPLKADAKLGTNWGEMEKHA